MEKYYLMYIFTANCSIKWKTFCLISSSSPLITFKVRIGPCYFFHTCKMQKPVFRTPGGFPAGKSHYAVRMFLLAVGSICVQKKKIPVSQAYWNCTNQYTVLIGSDLFHIFNSLLATTGR